MKLILVCVYFYFLDKIWWYYQIKHDCKKHSGNCNCCDNFLCPRFEILHKEEDKIFIDKIKSKIKNKFTINRKSEGS